MCATMGSSSRRRTTHAQTWSAETTASPGSPLRSGSCTARRARHRGACGSPATQGIAAPTSISPIEKKEENKYRCTAPLACLSRRKVRGWNIPGGSLLQEGPGRPGARGRRVVRGVRRPSPHLPLGRLRWRHHREARHGQLRPRRRPCPVRLRRLRDSDVPYQLGATLEGTLAGPAA